MPVARDGLMPKIAEIDDTPNPNAVKFTLHAPLTWGISHAYDNAAQADGNVLGIHYQGACGTCPSSISGTLRGIESLVRMIEPDMHLVAV